MSSSGHEKCEKHGKELVLFCLGENVSETHLCLLPKCEDHKKHEVKEIEDHVKRRNHHESVQIDAEYT